MNYFVVFLVLFLPCVSADFYPVNYRNCKSRFQILSVEVSDCQLSDRCVFEHETEPVIRIGFKPDRNVKSLKTSIWARLPEGALSKFYIENDNACDGSNITCPLTPSEIYWFTKSVKVIKEYPTCDVLIHFLLIDPDEAKSEKGFPLSRDICVKFHARVIEKKTE